MSDVERASKSILAIAFFLANSRDFDTDLYCLSRFLYSAFSSGVAFPPCIFRSRSCILPEISVCVFAMRDRAELYLENSGVFLYLSTLDFAALLFLLSSASRSSLSRSLFCLSKISALFSALILYLSMRLWLYLSLSRLDVSCMPAMRLSDSLTDSRAASFSFSMDLTSSR